MSRISASNKGRASESRPRLLTQKQIEGYRSVLQSNINASDNGAYAMVDLRTATRLVQICLQAEAHAQPTPAKKPSLRHVTSGNCPKCGTHVQTPGPITVCSCGQWLRNETQPIGRHTYLIPVMRRTRNTKRLLPQESVI